MQVLILVDYRGQFWLKATHKEANFDLPLLKSWFIKLTDGDQSKHVRLLATPGEKRRIPKCLSRTFHPCCWSVNRIKPYLRKIYPGYRAKSDHRRKFIIQNFVPGLEGDYKVLVFGEKYYVLHRKNRENDFRASGSGRFSFERELPPGLLDYAAKAFECFDVPFISLDIARGSEEFFLMEFQFVHFGAYTLEKSPFHFVERDGHWQLMEGPSTLEEEFARAVCTYINRQPANADWSANVLQGSRK